MKAKKKVKFPLPVKALRTQGRTRGVAKVTSTQTVRILERRYKVLEMRRQGCSMKEIADSLQVCEATVSEDIKAILTRTAEDSIPTEIDRALEAERFDALTSRFQPLAEAGNIAAAGMALSISDRRRKLLALDKPEQKSTDQTAVRVYVGVNVEDV